MKVPQWELDAVKRQQVFEKVKKRFAELQMSSVGWDFCPELNPDIIVISTDQTMLFEPQNQRASEWLQRRCGTGIEDGDKRNSIRVHPSQAQRIVEELKAAGFAVAC
jgi:hypothetical protein